MSQNLKKHFNKELSKYEFLDTAFYNEVATVINESRKSIYNYVNSSLVVANWKIGKMIDEKQNSLSRAEYGKKLISELANQMTKDFGSGYSERCLWMMRKFFRTFPILNTVCSQLSWSHYRLLISTFT